MTVDVSPTTKRPTHHVKLSKSGTEVGLILCDARGNENKNITRVPYPSRAINMRTERGKYSDQEPPFMTIPLDDFSGGRGMETWENDKTRYNDGWRIDTVRPGRVILGPQETYCTGDHRADLQYLLPGSIDWDHIPEMIYGFPTQYQAQMFQTNVGYDCTGFEVWIQRYGDPDCTITAAIYSESSGKPGTSLKSVQYSDSDLPQDGLSRLFRFEFDSAYTLTSYTNYFLVLTVGSGGDDSNYWNLLVSSSGTTHYQAQTPGEWYLATGTIYHRILDDAADFDMQMFQYKGAQYGYTQPHSGGTSVLYINGDRGTADSNSGDKSKLNDSTKTWWADEFIGCKVVITRGPGSEEQQPWREITDNDSSSLTVEPDWNVTHTTDTEYVIVGQDNWIQVESLGAYVTDHAVTKDFVYFARGDTGSNAVLRYQAYNNAGVWTDRSAAEIMYARWLEAIYDPSVGMVLWGCWHERDPQDIMVWKGRVPRTWGALFKDHGTLVDTDTPWDVRKITSVIQSKSEGNTSIYKGSGITGIIAVEDLDDPIDVTIGSNLGFMICSSVSTSSGDLEVVIDDSLDLGEAFYTADMVLDWQVAAQTAMTQAGRIDGQSSTITMLSTGYIIVGVASASKKFNRIVITMGSTKNAVADSTMSGEYWDGDEWQSLEGFSDGTASGGVTLAQSGTVSFTMPREWNLGDVENSEEYYIRLGFDKNLTASIDIEHVTTQRTNNHNIDIPALTANEWQWVSLAGTFLRYPRPDHGAIQSVGINCAVDNGAQFIYLHGGIKVIDHVLDRFAFPANIRGIDRYSGNEDDPRENPWVLTDAQPYEIQTQNDNIAVPISLREMEAMASADTGRAHTVNDVYLWFNLASKIERYHNRQMTDVGPDRDAGLPSDRQGTPAWMVSYPGQIIMGIDGGEDNFSSILASTGGAGWHELYRAPMPGLRIRGQASVQSIPGSNVARLWFSHGEDILYIPLCINPEAAADYRFCHEAALTTGRIHADIQDIQKYWSSIKLITENLEATRQVFIYVDYRVDGTSTWTKITDFFDESPSQENDISAAYDAEGKWIELRIRFYTNDSTITPVLYALTIEALEIQAIKYAYPLTFKVMDKQHDLLGKPDDYATADAKISQIDSWVAEATPIIMNTITTTENNQVVFPQPVPVRTLGVYEEENSQREYRICQVELIGI